MKTNIYIVPIIRDRYNRRVPAFNPSSWLNKPFGHGVDLGILSTTTKIVSGDIYDFDKGGDLPGFLRAHGVESKWIKGAGSTREALHRAAGVALAMQGKTDNPDVWLSRRIRFGEYTLPAFDQRAFAQERYREIEQRRKERRLETPWPVVWYHGAPHWLYNGMLVPVIQGGALPASDTFTANNGTQLTTYSANWTLIRGDFDIYSNQLELDSAVTNATIGAYWNADAFNANQFASISVYCNPVTRYCYMGALTRGAAGAFYGWWMGEDERDLVEWSDSTETQLGRTVYSISEGTFTVRLEASGTTLTPYIDGSTANTPGATTDNTLASGSAGVCGWQWASAGDRIYTLGDGFSANNLSAGVSGSASGSASGSRSRSPSASGSPSGSPSGSRSGSPSASASGSRSGSPSLSQSASGSPSGSPSASRSISQSPSGSPSGSRSGSPSASPSLSQSVSGSPSGSASGSPSSSPSGSPSGSPSTSPSESPSVSLSTSPSPSPGITASVCWGHVTGVVEDNVRTFAGNWSGTGAIENAGDLERVALESGEYMASEIVDTGARTVELDYNHYRAGDAILLRYRHGATPGDCAAAAWVNYTVPFISLGYVQVRLESTL